MVCHVEDGRDRDGSGPARRLVVEGKPPLTMAQLPKECGDVLKAGGFEPPIPKEGVTTERPPAILAALATKDAGPPVPVLTPAQLKALLDKKRAR